MQSQDKRYKQGMSGWVIVFPVSKDSQMLWLKMEKKVDSVIVSPDVRENVWSVKQSLGCELVHQDRYCNTPGRTRRVTVSMEGRRDCWQHSG